MRSIPDLHISSNIIGVATSLVLWMAEVLYICLLFFFFPGRAIRRSEGAIYMKY